MIAHDLNRFLHPAAPGYNVLGDQKLLARRDCKAAPKHEAARAILLREDMSFPEVAGDFLSDNDSPDSWRDYHRGLIFSELLCQQTAYARGDRGILQQERTLEKLSTMQPGAKHEVPAEQGSCAVEEIEDFIHEEGMLGPLENPTRGLVGFFNSRLWRFAGGKSAFNHVSDLLGIRLHHRPETRLCPLTG
jgi:hypothetical protein